jgi:hypothetical protein
MPTRTPVRRDDPEYMKLYRAARPRLRERDAKQREAWSIAQRCLRERHDEEFRALYDEAKREVGL